MVDKAMFIRQWIPLLCSLRKFLWATKLSSQMDLISSVYSNFEILLIFMVVVLKGDCSVLFFFSCWCILKRNLGLRSLCCVCFAVQHALEWFWWLFGQRFRIGGNPSPCVALAFRHGPGGVREAGDAPMLGAVQGRSREGHWRAGTVWSQHDGANVRSRLTKSKSKHEHFAPVILLVAVLFGLEFGVDFVKQCEDNLVICTEC